MSEHDIDADMIGTQIPSPMHDAEDEDPSSLFIPEGPSTSPRNRHQQDTENALPLSTPQGPLVSPSIEPLQDTNDPCSPFVLGRPSASCNSQPLQDAGGPSSLFIRNDQRLQDTATATPRQTTIGTGVYARIRSIQQKRLEQKRLEQEIATRNQAAPHPNRTIPDAEAFLDAVVHRPSSSTSAPAASEDAMASRHFLKQQRYYEDLKRKRNGILSFQEDVEWMRIKGNEEARKRKIARDLAKSCEDGENDTDLFSTGFIARNAEEEGSDEQSRPQKRPLSSPEPAYNPNSMAHAELASMRVAMEAQADQPRKKKKGAAADDDSQAPVPSGRAKGKAAAKPANAKAAPRKAANSGGRGTAKKKREVEHAVRQATSLFQSDIFLQQAGANAPNQPTFSSRNKTDALKQLLASLPVNSDHKKAKDDMNILLEATKAFDGHGACKADKGNWLVKGMRTSLKSYQVLGSAFMRRRENGLEDPRGGLMADQMGLGKTLMMLANIVNGQPPKKDKDRPRTTLLIASPALLTQWKSEIEQHTNCGLTVMRYGHGSRINSTHGMEILGRHDIILATYTEIMHSYPKNEPPIECQTPEQQMAWWVEQYETKRGPLHRMRFLRVVLDEAQAIKNHQSRTSIACRALMADHRWALSGTPILNSITELYPYFKFLNVPHTGSFKIFKHNYCDTKNMENTERLLVRLSQFMIRRTHADEMFGAPILTLPQADQTTYWCEFNSIERTVYEIVRQRFAQRISSWVKDGTMERSYSHAMVMLLRLRQLTSHILMLQFVMQDLLEVRDIEQIRQMIEYHEKQSSTNNRNRNTVTAMDSDDLLDDDEPENVIEPKEPSNQKIESGGSFGKNFNFKPYLEKLQSGESWGKAIKKAKCSYCDQAPRRPLMPSCGHLICTACRSEADVNAAADDQDSASCKVCHKVPTYIHECEVGEFDVSDGPARGTRGGAKKKKEKESQRVTTEDIPKDWLDAVGDDVLPSAKTIAVKSQILNWQKEKADVKIIVYTQFLAMIRILKRVFATEGWTCEEYHGKMSLKKRDDAIAAFADTAGPVILLASLRCGGLGLNLTMASKVIMIDPWWNSASEQQAFCRVFRIGQNEKTFMSRLCVKNTVDEHLVQMQERKQEEIDVVMEEDGSVVKKMDTRALMRLFGNTEADTEGFILM
ncbi:HepA Superfamily II DNA-RNA helicase [Pyrenophora tritici-repentis]|nr:HepA Superfamily II DNA-RNA helicase [Pyrenophora tritici-repentis]